MVELCLMCDCRACVLQVWPRATALVHRLSVGTAGGVTFREREIPVCRRADRVTLAIAARGQALVVPALLLAGADPNAPRSDSMAPLHVAACFGHGEVLQALLRGGANPHSVEKYGRTSLHLAVYWRHESCVPILLQSGLDPTARDDKGATPLAYATERGVSADCLRLLEKVTKR